MDPGLTGPQAAKAIREYEKKTNKVKPVTIIGLTGADQ